MTSPYDPFACPCNRCVMARLHVAEPLTGIEQAALQPLKEQYERRGWQDRERQSVPNAADELDRFIAEWMAGEVGADD